VIEDGPVEVGAEQGGADAADPAGRGGHAGRADGAPALRRDPAAASATVDWYGVAVAPGEEAETSLAVGETYSGASVRIPMHVRRGRRPGPTVFVTGAVHGDEINGTGAIRELVAAPPFELAAGTLVLVPVINLFGFERHSRYLPDRRDLNRAFPGSPSGPLAARLAYAVFEGLIRHCDYGIDLHTAAVRRTNYPNVRADLGDEGAARLARAFGAELIVAGKGPSGSLRRSATAAGVPTIILEAGETSKVEPAIMAYAVRGVHSALKGLGMVEGEPDEPPFHLEVDRTHWVRADTGGFLRFHVAPGETVAAGDVIATNTTLTGREQNQLVAPRGGVVLGMATNPAVAPGDPVVHLAYARSGVVRRVERALGRLEDDSLESRLRDDLATSLHVDEPPEPEEADEGAEAGAEPEAGPGAEPGPDRGS
jgi:predicted deacylase